MRIRVSRFIGPLTIAVAISWFVSASVGAQAYLSVAKELIARTR